MFPILYIIAACVAGACVVGLFRFPLRLEERLAMSIIIGCIGTAAITLILALPFGQLNGINVWGGIVILIAASLGVSILSGSVIVPWEKACIDFVERWKRKQLHWVIVTVVIATAFFIAIFAVAIINQDGNLQVGYSTVWADWSLHATLASSFSVAHNIPPHDPLFSGGTLRYPFIPDFQSGILLSLGATIGTALSAPSALVAIAVAVLVVCFAQRVTSSYAVGVLTLIIVLFGGSFGFLTLFHDACVLHGFADSQCSAGYLAQHPEQALPIFGGTLESIPAAIAHPIRSYDNLLNSENGSIANVVWYTPLFTWWLPQRTFAFGFGVALTALVLLHASRGQGKLRTEFVVLGILLGLLPLIHVHTAIALAFIVPIWLWRYRCKEWIAIIIPGAIVALPRLLQVAAAGSGSANSAYGNDTFPWIEPGWLSGVFPYSSHGPSPGFLTLILNGIEAFFIPKFWLFWLMNSGVIIVVFAGFFLFAIVTWFTDHKFHKAYAAIPSDVRRLALAGLAMFVVSNIVIFQSWDWDNTKVLSYWYFVAALLFAVIVVRGIKSAGWWAVVAVVMVPTVVASGFLSFSNIVPWSPWHGSGPYGWQSIADQKFATDVDAKTPRNAVFLTTGNPTDPTQTLAGRTSVEGYSGWLYSYGTNFGSRPDDIVTMVAGCADNSTDCEATALFKKYDVSYVVVETGGQTPITWLQHNYPVIINEDGMEVFDVRH